MSDEGNMGASEPDALSGQFKKIEGVETKLTVEVGSTFITIRDLLKLNIGSVVELDTVAGEHLKILVNGVPLARGEIVIMGETLGIRFTDVISPDT
jgi:flagellar motor switch protein FliN/FliY